MSSEKIFSLRCEHRQTCSVCGTDGAIIIRNVPDKLFGVSGEWSFRRCQNRHCGHLWIDPKPIKEDLGICYANYYTHAPETAAKKTRHQSRWWRRLYDECKREYVARRYHYASSNSPHWLRALGYFLYWMYPQRIIAADLDIRFLSFVKSGRLLDVGCGNGAWMQFMSSLGWQAEGIDFDIHAVNIARKNGLNVMCGDLTSVGYATESFDAVTLSHVIEHLPDFNSYLNECFRILKPNGTIVITTPNSEGWGLRIFRESWRGLEPPRHLNIFSRRSLLFGVQAAGFTKIRCHAICAPHILYASQLLKKNHFVTYEEARLPFLDFALVGLLGLIEALLVVVGPTNGGQLALVAQKPDLGKRES